MQIYGIYFTLAEYLSLKTVGNALFACIFFLFAEIWLLKIHQYSPFEACNLKSLLINIVYYAEKLLLCSRIKR